MITGPVAVTGATGFVGRRVAAALASAGVRVVALARDPSRLELGRAGVEGRRCDYDEPASVRAALAGVASLVFVSSDGEADVVVRQHLAVVDAAAAAGVRRIAYLSSIDADPFSPFCYGRTNGATEQALAAAIDDVRVVRAGLYGSFLRGLMGDGEEVRLPEVGPFATVSREAVADALATAVTDEAPGLRFAVAGECTFADLAAEQGRPFVPVPLDDYRGALVAAGASPWWSYAYASMMQSISEGRFLLR